jgi:hypothetical protein
LTSSLRIIFSALVLLALEHGQPARAASVQVIQLERFDGQHNGSIDVDIGVGHNLRQDAPIECNVLLDGVIDVGDLEKLQAILDQQRERGFSDVPRLCLNSPGGDYREGLRIARYLMEKSIGTAVAEEAECYSACAIVFMGGTFPWKGELNRYLHVRGILGFHAPYIAGAAGEGKVLVESEQVRLAFSEGIRSMSEFMRLGVGNDVKRVTPELMSEMMAQGPDAFYNVDTVGKAIRFRIHLYGIDRELPVDEAGMCNACVSMNYFALERYGAGGDPDLCKGLGPPRREAHPKGIRYTSDVAPRGGQCTIDVTMDGGNATAWTFRNDSQDEFGGGLELAYWYLLSPSTSLSDLSEKPARTTQEQDSERLRLQLYRFIALEYLGHGLVDHRGRADLFGPRVNYYKRGVISRDAVMAEKANYYKRWPRRQFELIEDSLRAIPGRNNTVDISFRYTYEVANDKDARSGNGFATLGVARIDGRFVIVSEDGGVERRN